MFSLHELAYKLSKHPKLKRIVKDLYQHFGNILSDRKTVPANVVQISSEKSEHLFGYYDKSPWNMNDKKMIYLEVFNANKEVAPAKKANIILKDLELDKEFIVGETKTWNIQQGCMLQWLGPDYNSKIIYNDFRNEKYISVIRDLESNGETIIDSPVYSVSRDGKIALSLDFSRLHRLRPGYGYSNLQDNTKNEKCPNKYCVFKVDLVTGEVRGIIKYEALLKIDSSLSMEGAEHKVNHIMISPNGKKFMFLHRWIKDGIKKTRLLTANIDGTDIYNLLDEDMVSHCNWKDDESILCWARKDNENHYFLLKDKSYDFKIIAKNELNVDGHPSYSPNGKYFITDTYPDFKRKQKLMLYNIETNKTFEIASIYSNIKYMNDCRCDLHPRWNHKGTVICFDGAQKGLRQVYTIDVSDLL